MFAIQLKYGLHALHSIRPAPLPDWGCSHAQPIRQMLYQTLKLGSPYASAYPPAMVQRLTIMGLLPGIAHNALASFIYNNPSLQQSSVVCMY